MCTIFKKYGVCQDGINCAKSHDYKNPDVNLCIALNVIIGGNAKIMKELEFINSRLDKLENSLDLMKDTTKNVNIVLNKIKSIDDKMENICHASKSGGLPLKAVYTSFQNSNTAFPIIPSVAGHSQNINLNSRAMRATQAPTLGTEIAKSDTSSSEKTPSRDDVSLPDDISHQFAVQIQNAENLRDELKETIDSMDVNKDLSQSSSNQSNRSQSNTPIEFSEIIEEAIILAENSEIETKHIRSGRAKTSIITKIRKGIENLSNTSRGSNDSDSDLDNKPRSRSSSKGSTN